MQRLFTYCAKEETAFETMKKVVLERKKYKKHIIFLLKYKAIFLFSFKMFCFVVDDFGFVFFDKIS